MLRAIGIVGTAYCGSTALGMALGSHPDACFVGEVGQAVRDLWHAPPLDADTIDWHKAKFGSPAQHYARSVLCFECGDTCEVWRPTEYPLDPQKVHHVLAERLQTSVLIDSTKYISSYRVFDRGTSVEEWAYVLLIKTPARQIASFKRNQPNLTPAQVASAYCGHYKSALEFLAGRNFVTQDYAEFAANPIPALNKIGALSGLAPDKYDPVGYARKTHHQISGNYRAKQAKAPIHVDNTWVEFRVSDAKALEQMNETYQQVTGKSSLDA